MVMVMVMMVMVMVMAMTIYSTQSLWLCGGRGVVEVRMIPQRHHRATLSSHQSHPIIIRIVVMLAVLASGDVDVDGDGFW